MYHFCLDNANNVNNKNNNNDKVDQTVDDVPESVKLYVQLQLENQRKEIRQISLKIDAHLSSNFDKSTIETSSSSSPYNLVTYEQLKNDIIRLKASNTSLFHKFRNHQIEIESHRNQLILLESKVSVQLREMSRLRMSSSSVLYGETKNDILNLKVSNITLYSKYRLNSVEIERQQNEMKLLDAKLSLLQVTSSPVSLEHIQNDITKLKAWNITLYSKYRNNSIYLAKLHNNFVLLLSQVNTNTADVAQFQITNKNDQFTKWYTTLNTKLEDYKKELMKIISKLNDPNSTRGYLFPSTPKIGKEIGYCTVNVPLTACLPCSCIPTDKIYNKYTCDCSNLKHKKDCKEYFDSGFRINGIYTIIPDGSTKNISVYCEHNNGGGWAVIQRRFNSDVGFYRNWAQYKEGFGDLGGNHYLGNEYISILTQVDHEIRIDLTTFSNVKYYALYSQFSVKNESFEFELICSGYTGNVGDSFCGYHSGNKFSTFDKDHDTWSVGNCAESYRGGWWYKNCAHSNLNSHYFSTTSVCPLYTGIHWYAIGQSYNSLKETEMKIRRLK